MTFYFYVSVFIFCVAFIANMVGVPERLRKNTPLIEYGDLVIQGVMAISGAILVLL